MFSLMFILLAELIAFTRHFGFYDHARRK
jgi:hypothetical protein